MSFFFHDENCKNYNVVHLEDGPKQYKYACVVGKTTKYAWILSRTPNPPEQDMIRLISVMHGIGVDVNKLLDPQKDNKRLVDLYPPYQPI